MLKGTKFPVARAEEGFSVFCLVQFSVSAVASANLTISVPSIKKHWFVI